MKRGFSLAETIIASFLLSLVTLAIFNLFPSSAMMAKRGEMSLIADSLAAKHIEAVRGSEFKTLALGPLPAVAPVKQEGTEYNVTGEILKEPGSDERFLKVVRITVSWQHSQKNYSVIHEAWLTSVRP